MTRPTQDPSTLNIVARFDQLLTKERYAALMRHRGITSISAYRITMLEQEGRLPLDYVAVGSRFFVIDTPENQARIAALRERHDKRSRSAAAWAADYEHAAAGRLSTPVPALSLPTVGYAAAAPRPRVRQSSRAVPGAVAALSTD